MRFIRLSRAFASVGLFGALMGALAAVPPAEQLLPADTFVVGAIPDMSKMSAVQKDAPFARLWADPAMRPFADKLEAKIKSEWIEPFERETGLKVAELKDLAQGQLTLGLTLNGWTGAQGQEGVLLLLDTKEKSDLLKKLLADVKRKLSESNQKVRLEKIREVEFTIVPMPKKEQKKAGETAEAATEKQGDGASGVADKAVNELAFAQVDTLLLMGTVIKDLEKVLIRLSGGSAPCLGEQSAFEAVQKGPLREAQGYVWVDCSPVVSAVMAGMKEAAVNAPNQNPMAPKPEKILGALGLTGLKVLALTWRQTPEAGASELYIGAPEDQRKGLLSLLSIPQKDAGPPAFVPADAAEFTRWRLDGQKLWTSLESIVNEISPGILNFMITQLETAMKEKNPDYSFRKEVIGNLGDDLLSYKKAPRGQSLEELSSPPSLTLVASPNPEQLLQGLRSVMLLTPLGGAMGEMKEREFLGRKIYSIPMPSMPAPGGGEGKERSLHLATSGGYLAFSGDTAVIEEYLRSSENKPKPLAEVPAIVDAAAKVGGTGAGLFGYQDDKENMRAVFEAMRVNADSMLASLNIPLAVGKGGSPAQALKEWADFSLLPPFDKVAKYFSITVYAGKSSAEAYSVKFYSPVPPAPKE